MGRILAAALLALSILPALPALAADGTGDVWCWDHGWFPGRGDGSCHREDADIATPLPLQLIPPMDVLTPILEGVASSAAMAAEGPSCPLGYEMLKRDDGTQVCATDVRPVGRDDGDRIVDRWK